LIQRLRNEDDISSADLLTMIEGELQLANNLIVKKRSIEMLKVLSDFDDFQKDTTLQTNLIQGVFRTFASEEADNADLCLKMACIDYMKNFYNDYQFKVTTYAPMLPQVIQMSSAMLLKSQSNTDVVNEILDLYRFIVDKYASMQIMMADGT